MGGPRSPRAAHPSSLQRGEVGLCAAWLPRHPHPGGPERDAVRHRAAPQRLGQLPRHGGAPASTWRGPRARATSVVRPRGAASPRGARRFAVAGWSHPHSQPRGAGLASCAPRPGTVRAERRHGGHGPGSGKGAAPWGCPAAVEDGGAVPARGGSLCRGSRTRYGAVPPSASSACWGCHRHRFGCGARVLCRRGLLALRQVGSRVTSPRRIPAWGLLSSGTPKVLPGPSCPRCPRGQRAQDPDPLWQGAAWLLRCSPKYFRGACAPRQPPRWQWQDSPLSCLAPGCFPCSAPPQGPPNPLLSPPTAVR